MSIRVPSATALFEWLRQRQVAYAVLRAGPLRPGEAWPDDDIDLLLADDAVPTLRGTFTARRGIKVDLYGVRGLHGSDYHGFSHLPESLGVQILQDRQQVSGHYRPDPKAELLALAYHAAYHKAVQSAIPFDVAAAREAQRVPSGPYGPAIARAANACGLPVPMSLRALHELLVAHELAADYARLCAYVRHDFRHGRKSYLHAWLMDREPGELNLFVIRAVAVRHGLAEGLLERLRTHYEVLQVKRIGLWTRLTRAPHMRGGKWRRGGRPHVAVVVYDPAPEPSTVEERQVHPFVFNRRQFAKVGWRDWFTQTSGARAKDNPIHSTDNEAEAVGHLPLFFEAPEIDAIMASLATRRLTPAHGQAASDHHAA